MTAIHQLYTHMQHLYSIPFGDKSILTVIIQHYIKLLSGRNILGQIAVEMFELSG